VQAVLKAGLQPVFCDVSINTLDLDQEALLESLKRPLLAIIPTHLYGLAQDVSDLVRMGSERGFYIIEDAAQAFGARINGCMVGNAGHAGIFSLGRGKCLPTGHGGVILTQDGLEPHIAETIRNINFGATRRELASLFTFIGYGLATTPFGWWFIARSPINPAQEGMDSDALPPVEIGGFSATQAAIGLSILERLEAIQATRLNNAQRLIDLLFRYEYITLPELHPESEPVFLRMPIVVDDHGRAEQLYERLSEVGIGVSRSYYRTLPDMFSVHTIPAESDFPGAEHLAACLLTLPTHQYLREQDFIRMKYVFDTLNRSKGYARTTT
jgi:dTDP-4-amino-4,6-dideoxygalactose transaminase